MRLEVITSFYEHPGEMIVNSIIGSLLVYTVLDGTYENPKEWAPTCGLDDAREQQLV